MGRPPHTRPGQATPKWFPPIPPEHGARSMLGVALALPLSVALGVPDVLDAWTLLAYVVFALLAIGVLFFREAVRRRLRVPPEHHRRFTIFSVVQGAALLVLVAGLVALEGPWWLLGVLIIPAVLGDVVIRRRGIPIPLWDEVSGVLAISLAVPVGTILLGIGSLRTAALLFVLFVGFHLLGLARVKTVVNRDGDGYGRIRSIDIGVHVLILLVSGAVWMVGDVGTAVPLVFVLSLGRAVWLVLQDETPPIPKLGRGERAFSFVLVILGPWLLA